MNTLSSRSGAGYRTKCMTRPRALAFAAAIRANRTFILVGVFESGRVRDPEQRWSVHFRPASADRARELLKEHCRTAEQRATEQQDHYAVARDPSGLFFWVCNLLSGETYQTALGYDCDCPQGQFRTNGTAAYCKHDSVVKIKLALGQVSEFQPPTPLCDRETGEVLDDTRYAQALADRRIWD